jgi:hypothetical protein
MKVSFFKQVKDTAPKLNKDVGHFLDRIKDGASKELVEKIRNTEDEDEQKFLKVQLPVVCFNGQFNTRSKSGLKKSSGLMVLDFDDLSSLDEAKELKKNIKSDIHVFSAWISPRNGVKVLYRIPPVANDNEFKNIFKSIKEKYPNLDPSGSDVSRACFESYDPLIYVNLEAEVYTPTIQIIDIEPIEIGDVTNIPINDQDVIANKLVIWFQKHYDRTNRNNSVFKLAAAFNDFGVNKQTAMVYCSRYAEAGFPVAEITNIVNSAYKHTAQFSSKFFEDKPRKKKLMAMVMSGKKEKDIQQQFSDIDTEKLNNEINIIRETTKINEFWEYSSDGKLQINSFKMKLYLQSLNYYKYYPVGNDKTFVFISKAENFLEEVNEYKIKDHVIRNLEAANEIDVFNLCANRTKLFTTPYLSMIDTAHVDFLKDEKDFAMIYYQNNAVKVYQDKYEIYDYDELDFYIWKDQVIKRDFITEDHHESMFRTFLWLISGQEVERYNSMKSVIGYMLHSYKTNANNKAIILNDEVISDNPNGGSGKGLLTNAISQMKKVSTIDGKTFDFNKSFPYQTVSTDCQVLAFDDVKKNFDFEKLFSIITEGITIEYKGKDAVKLPVKDSPKVLISTNYTIRAEGGSFTRRMFEVELSSYFGAHRSPLDEFNCMLFDDWDTDEWARFDHFMINCIQYYLEHGLVAYEHKNLKIRKLINQTSKEFIDWMDDKKFTPGQQINYKQWFETFVSEYEDFKKWLTNRNFNSWIRAYFEFKKIEIDNVSSNGQRYYEIKSDIPNTKKDEDLPF